MTELQKPIVGFTCGDINGIGMETVIKTVSDSRITELCTPVIFAGYKCVNFYRKSLPDCNFQYQSLRELSKLNPRTVNIMNVWEEDVAIQPGQLNETGGLYARKSLTEAANALKSGQIHALVTAPIHKKNIQAPDFSYTGHTPFLKTHFGAAEVVMLMVSQNMRVALMSEHVPLSEASSLVTREGILKKLQVLQASLQKDFRIDKPRMAVLGLNPHAGDEGLIGTEEEAILKPALKEARQKGMLAYGPYPADAFFARAQYERFDAVLAMYHDQGLIPFKSLSLGEGVNYSAGLPAVRTSPDHGTAFDIAGQGKADASSTLAALFAALDILVARGHFAEMRSQPLRRMSQRIVANAVDEKIEDE
jgi:4-hydroxythreonine-4-phosphate dehydrogenase